MERNSFGDWLGGAAGRIGAHSAACIRMDNPLLGRLVGQNNALVAGWLAEGRHGEMDYLRRMFPEKSDPWKTFPFARSAVVLAFANRWGEPEAPHPFPPPARGAPLGHVSAYARGSDYHAAGHAMLAQLGAQLGGGIRAAASVDTGAVYERLFAAAGGLGVVGGNGLLRVPGPASVRVFIGCLFVDAELPEVVLQPQMAFACDGCRACLRNCPTGAIAFGRPIDARKCISYLTTAKRGVLDRDEAEAIGDWLFGCDGCTAACPPRDPRDARIPVDLEWLLTVPAAELRRRIKGSAVAYAGAAQLRKNAVALLKAGGGPAARRLLAWVDRHSGSALVRRQIAAW